MPEPIYLDNHSTTPVDPRVLEAMRPWFAEHVGNAASRSHSFGIAARDAVEGARHQIAETLGAMADEIVFTSGATESNNLAIKGVRPTRVVTSATEHRAVLDPVRRLRRERADVVILPVDSFGAVRGPDLDSAISPETSLVSVMLANNEVGTLTCIDEVAAICRNRGVLLHTDAAQAVGRINVDLRELNVDLLSLTAHKLYGPQGVGALFVRKRTPPIRISPQIDGGGHEQGLRSGTLPVALIVGFAEACRLSSVERESDAARIAGLRDRLQQTLLEQLDDVTVNGHAMERLAGNLNVSFGGVDGDALLASLNGLAVSSGSACSSADPQPSHVLQAMGVPDDLARASLRFGIGRFTTDNEIEQAAQIVIDAVTTLRQSRHAR